MTASVFTSSLSPVDRNIADNIRTLAKARGISTTGWTDSQLAQLHRGCVADENPDESILVELDFAAGMAELDRSRI